MASPIATATLVQTLTDGLSDSRFLFRQSPRRRLKKSVLDAIGTAPQAPLEALQSIIAEGDLQAFDKRRASRRWAQAYYLLGLPAAVLATVAGATGLISTTGRVTAALIALASAGLTAAATFLNSEQSHKVNDRLSAAWQTLADDARLEYLQRVQSIDNQHHAEEVLGLEYWQHVLLLQRRKSRLLRGDLSTVDSDEAAPDPNLAPPAASTTSPAAASN